MYRNLVAASALAVGLAGCSMGISQNGSSPRSEFKAPVAFEDAYATAIRQSRDCLRSADDAYRVVADLNESARSVVCAAACWRPTATPRCRASN
jgi:hypothetical protein